MGFGLFNGSSPVYKSESLTKDLEIEKGQPPLIYSWQELQLGGSDDKTITVSTHPIRSHSRRSCNPAGGEGPLPRSIELGGKQVLGVV